ncbi:MAG: GFA family protein [Alphaproteobacteria bacterium]|nr:GFA family protein [Alphaproteobacteria bacterium]
MSSESQALSGACLCGAVKFTVTTENSQVGVCHCSMCRTWSGGVVFALDEVKDLKIQGEDNLGVYKSSEWAERCFCKKCGSNLFWRSEQLGHTVVMAGAIEDQSSLKFASEIFIDAKPDYYAFANDTKKYTEAEVLAQFSDVNNKTK